MEGGFLQQKKYLNVLAISVVVLCAIFFFIKKTVIIADYTAANAAMPAINIYMYKAADLTGQYLGKFGFAGGLLFGLISYVIYSILHFIAKLVKLTNFKQTVTWIGLIGSGLLLALAIELVYYEVRYSPISNGVIFFFGIPLLYTAWILTIINVGILVYFNIQLLRKFFVWIFHKASNGTRAAAHHAKKLGGKHAK